MNNNIFDSSITLGQKDGAVIEKGIVLSEDFLEENETHLQDLFNYFTAYPDLFLDLITPSDQDITLFFYQRIMLRALMRFKEVYITACRATSKTFLAILALILQCVFMPGTKRFIIATHKVQAAKIAKEKILEIYEHWPLLRREVVGGDVSTEAGNFGKDYVTLVFRNGSKLDVVGGDSTRGLRRHGRIKFLFLYPSFY